MKRFYESAAAEETQGGWRVTLDGRPIKTAAGHPQTVPGRALAEAMAQEWNDQGEKLDASTLILRDAADHAIDIVAPDPAATIDKLLAFAETDTLCYRADPDEPLYRRQMERWEPLVTAAEAKYDIQFERISGIMHRPQPDTAVAILRGELGKRDAFQLSALFTASSLAASLFIGLAAMEEGADAEALWALANLEEDWQAEQWGKDDAAFELRTQRQGNFADAIRFGALARE